MRFIVITIALASVCLGAEVNTRTARAPQRNREYSQPEGDNHYSENRFKSQLETPQRSVRAEYASVQPNRQHRESESSTEPAQEAKRPDQIYLDSVQYQPFSMLPSYIKDIMSEMYQPHGPYIDPSVYLYETQFAEEQSSAESSDPGSKTSESQTFETHAQYEPEYQGRQRSAEYTPPKDGKIHYKDEEGNRHGPSEQYGSADTQVGGIQQLLHLQSQIPYYVIANRIHYKPKSPFVPKPISEEEKGPYKYRSKIYYMKDGEIDQEEEKPTE